MMWILYGVLIVILGIVGYYVGKNYTSIGTTLGSGLGIAAGVLVSGAIWYSQNPTEELISF